MKRITFMKLHVIAVLCILSSASFLMSMQEQKVLYSRFLLNEDKRIQSCFKMDASNIFLVDYTRTYKGKSFLSVLELNDPAFNKVNNAFKDAQDCGIKKIDYTQNSFNYIAKITAYNLLQDKKTWNYTVKIKEVIK